MSFSGFNPKTSAKVDFAKTVHPAGLKGSSALITGGASGLGAAFAIALAKNGCHVTIVDLNAELGKTFIKKQEALGLKINFAQADVTDYTSLLQAFKSALAFSPKDTIDLVIPSAGLFGPPIDALLPDPTLSADPPAPSTGVLDVNFKGVYLTTYLALHYFRRASAHAASGPATIKQILFISSLLAYLEAPMNLSYCGSKHAVRGMFRSLRWESAELEIPRLQVNLIAPTLAKTPMTKDFSAYLQDVKGFAMSAPEEIVDVGLRLLSDPDVDGRAVAIIPGSGAVDLCDDFEGEDGGRESLELIQTGVLGKGPSSTGRFIV